MSARSFGKRFGCVGVVLVTVLSLAAFSSAMELFWTRVDQRRFPWAYEESGRPTLTGLWVGSLTTGRGAVRGLYLDLRLEPLDFEGDHGAFRRATSDKLGGELRMCGGSNGQQRFDVRGNDVADGASRFRLSFSTTDSVPPDGLAPSHLRGTWDGRDSLRIEVDLYLQQGKSAITSTADPETGTPQQGALRRAKPNDYPALCARLRGR
jgi:hypothetical protein